MGENSLVAPMKLEPLSASSSAELVKGSNRDVWSGLTQAQDELPCTRNTDTTYFFIIAGLRVCGYFV